MLIKLRERQGFTLVELMIVVAIIGILAAVAVPYYQRYVAKSKLTSLVMPTVHSIETNISTFYAVQGQLPTIASVSDLQIFTADGDTRFLILTEAPWQTPGNPARMKLAVNTSAQDSRGKTPFAAIGSNDGRNVFYLVATQGSAKQKLYWSYAGTLATELGLQ